MKMVFEAEDKDPKAYNFRVNGKIEQVIDTLFSAIGWELVTNVRDDVTEKELADYACDRMKRTIHEETLHKQAKKEGNKNEKHI
jgi:hypothetical protein